MDLSTFLEHSRATAGFRGAVRSFVASGRPNDRLRFPAFAPAIKVARALTKLVESQPELEIEAVEIEGTSGCNFFRGTARVRTVEAEHRFDFHWDCRWKAEQLGWRDYFGSPDQARAARECDWDCFREWRHARAVPVSAAEAR